MKKTSLLEKMIYSINAILATALLLSYALPFVSPKMAPSFAVVSLLVPGLLLINGVFFLYWLLKLKKQCLLSGMILAIGWYASSPLYKFTSVENAFNSDTKIMSYNVRLFNHYESNKDTATAQNIFDFIAKENPDILALQEFYEAPNIPFQYPYSYIKTKSKTHKFGLAFYSKFPIVNKGSLDFKNSANNAIYIDVLKEKDTLRIYNVHLESLKINPEKENFGEESSEKLIARLSNSFAKQAEQTKILVAHEQQWKGKKIVCGDFNNTGYSWVYKQIATDKKDAFIEAGKSFGKSFDYPFPLRIDFILTDNTATINQFQTFSVPYSDHFPIQARVSW